MPFQIIPDGTRIDFIGRRYLCAAISAALLLAGVVNLGIAAAAIVGSRVASPAATAAGNAAVQTPESNPEGRFILTVFFFSGLAALA